MVRIFIHRDLIILSQDYSRRWLTLNEVYEVKLGSQGLGIPQTGFILNPFVISVMKDSVLIILDTNWYLKALVNEAAT